MDTIPAPLVAFEPTWDLDAVRSGVRSLLAVHAPDEVRLSVRVSSAYLAPAHQRELPVASYVDLSLEDDQVSLTCAGAVSVVRVPPTVLTALELEAYETYRLDGTEPARAASLAVLTTVRPTGRSVR